jgi:hypothetical protein
MPSLKLSEDLRPLSDLEARSAKVVEHERATEGIQAFEELQDSSGTGGLQRVASTLSAFQRDPTA